MIKEFDLNIGQILENWGVHHAIRELIANALDEMKMTGSKDIQIYKDEDNWVIRDFGRGISYKHLIQDENTEKIENDLMIGRFGVGLKDALATLYRNNIEVVITSSHGIVTLFETAKNGFDDVITLHAKIETGKPDYVGTKIVLKGCSSDDIHKAKELFLHFTNSVVLDNTQYGEIIEKKTENACIFINGVKIAEEDNFMFSYNITSLTQQLKKNLNRERTNVGRSAYTDRIKSILLSCTNELVIEKLVDSIQRYTTDKMFDEMQWVDVATYACKKAQKNNDNVIFIDSELAMNENAHLDSLIGDGFKPIIVSSHIIKKIEENNANNAEYINTFDNFINEKRENISYSFVDFVNLNEKEQQHVQNATKILEYIEFDIKLLDKIKISETIYEKETYRETLGVYDPNLDIIVIKRKVLSDAQLYFGILIHECIHAITGYDDVTREFEYILTEKIGILMNIIINSNENEKL